MTRLIGITGSLRAASLNAALLRAAAALVPEGVALQIETLQGIPLYNEDVERSAFPEPVARLKAALAECSGLLISTPEYNHSMPGVLKNALDWLSRPPDDVPRIFGGLPVALIGASPGGFGTILAQTAWLPVFRTLGMQHWAEGRFMLSHAVQAFGSAGELTDPETRERLRQFVDGFGRFANRESQARKLR